MVKKVASVVFAGMLAVAALAGCSGGSDQAGDASSEEVRTMTIAVGNAYSPYVYVDENGEAAGFDVEVLKAIDEALPQYEFTYETMDFKNILLSVETGKAQLGSHQFSWNEERAQKYLYPETPFCYGTMYLVAGADNDAIQSIDDMGGKIVTLETGDASEAQINEWNEAHPDNPMTINWIDAPTPEEISAMISTGRTDAFCEMRSYVDDVNAEYGNTLKLVQPIRSDGNYFIVNQDEAQFCEDVNAVLAQFMEDGTIAKISNDTLGYDVSVPAE